MSTWPFRSSSKAIRSPEREGHVCWEGPLVMRASYPASAMAGLPRTQNRTAARGSIRYLAGLVIRIVTHFIITAGPGFMGHCGAYSRSCGTPFGAIHRIVQLIVY